MKLVLSIIFTVAILAGVNADALGRQALENSDRGYIVKVGDIVPAFTVTLVNGESVKISDLKGKVIMLQFTASWCSVCRKEMPFIEKEIWNKYKLREDFALMGVDRDEPKDKVLKFMADVGISYPMGMDPKAQIFSKFAFVDAGITRNVIINKKGEIAYLTRLFNREEFDKMKEVIEDLLNE